MSDVKLVEMSGEDVARLRLIREHEGNDLSPNDEELLRSLADSYENGITVEEARSLTAYENLPTRSAKQDDGLAKLRHFVERNPDPDA